MKPVVVFGFPSSSWICNAYFSHLKHFSNRHDVLPDKIMRDMEFDVCRVYAYVCVYKYREGVCVLIYTNTYMCSFFMTRLMHVSLVNA